MSYVSPINIVYEAEPEEGWTDKIGKYLAGEVDNLVLQSCVKVGCHVDKDELEKALRYDRDQYVKGYEDGKRNAAAAIEELQAQLPKRGEWVWKHRHHGGFKTAKGKCGCGRDVYAQIDERYETDDPYCPFCGVMNDSIHLNYCPNCGAKMEVQE